MMLRSTPVNKCLCLCALMSLLTIWPGKTGRAEDAIPDQAIFNDKLMLDGYTANFSKENLETILAMIQDESLDGMKLAAAIRVLRTKYLDEIFYPGKKIVEKNLLRRLNLTDSPFVQVEIMHALCRMDRYRYYKTMVPALIQKLDHYNSAVNELAYESLNGLTLGHERATEARIVFTTLRKVLFLSRRRLANITEPNTRLKQKLQLLRWSIKILGTQELNRLPKEVIHLL
ncbi:MAG: hypothetical protein Q8Q08_10600 [Candidatus Omnitrophota bacterium]|nr:hypothetical protein [Candidatus Omnitrophota bacterium]MDZ4242822.1 hypothetical protein [Candidatus Omnitrophota bacterium]